MAVAGAGEQSLEVTPTWAVAVVCAVFVIISVIIEHGIHFLGKWFQKPDKKAMSEALEKIKAELMLLGFISLLLTAGTKPVSKICIPNKAGDTMLPCSLKHNGNGGGGSGDGVVIFATLAIEEVNTIDVSSTPTVVQSVTDSLSTLDDYFLRDKLVDFDKPPIYDDYWEEEEYVQDVEIRSLIDEGSNIREYDVPKVGEILLVTAEDSVLDPSSTTLESKLAPLVERLETATDDAYSYCHDEYDSDWMSLKVRSYNGWRDDIVITTSVFSFIPVGKDFADSFAHTLHHITLPLYALVTQMGSQMKTTIFEEQTAKALMNWRISAKHMKKYRNSGMDGGSSTILMDGENTPSSSRGSSPVHLLHHHKSNSTNIENVVIHSPIPYNSES